MNKEMVRQCKNQNLKNINFFSFILFYTFSPNPCASTMDIEFIEQEHRDNIFKIMELCNCDMAEAYELYNNHGCNVENAVQAKFSNLQPHHQPAYNQPPSYKPVPSRGNNNNLYENDFNSFGTGDQEDDYLGYKIFKESGTNFNKKYEVRRDAGGLLKGVVSFFKSFDNGFKKKLEDFMGKRSNLKVSQGSLSQALEEVWKSKFPLLVHALDFSKQSSAKVKGIYSDELLVQIMNEQFQNYGLCTKDYALEEYLRPFIDLKTDANSLIVFRISIIDEITVMTKIPLNSVTVDEIKKKIKQIKSNCINMEMEELHLERKYQEELRGNFDYQKPMSLAERRKLKEDRQIRRKQEEEFYATMQPKTEEKPSIPTKTQTHQATTTAKNQQPKKDKKADAREERRKIREGLKLYESDGPGMLAIKLRVPSSEMLKLYVHESESAQYLYDYVVSREQNLGFEEDESKREFDIIEPYDKINLSERKEEKLGKIFEGETMLSLIVNEKIE